MTAATKLIVFTGLCYFVQSANAQLNLTRDSIHIYTEAYPISWEWIGPHAKTSAMERAWYKQPDGSERIAYVREPGKELFYYPDPGRKVYLEINYKNGQYHGLTCRYYKDGKYMEKKHYVNGELHGLYILYDPDGKWRKKTLFKNGKEGHTVWRDPV